MAYSAFGINYDTAAKISAYGGDAETPAQPIWAEDTNQLWIVHGTSGKYRVAMASELSAYLTKAGAGKTYATPESCTQLIYEINEFRRKSTAYQVGEKVDCAFQYERFLECTKAGTTSADMLDTRNVTHGQVIKDGTAEWAVRTHVRSINGTPAKADGDVPVDVGVKTVNGAKPDSSGNVNVALAAYPIGSIYMSTNSTDPGTLFGGTWQALNEGRVLIGASASHPAGETGGEETHTLTTREMPSHSHSGSTGSAGSHNHSGSATSSGDHKHDITYGSGETYSTMPQYDSYGTYRSTMYTSSAGSHSHSVSINSNGSHSHTVTINSTGGGQAHNNMQPYLSVYMWKRTA